MKSLLAVTLTTALLFNLGCMARTTQPDCPIEGELVQWIADYCMSKLETDDEIAAGDCIAEELKQSEKAECVEKKHYKQALCELARARGVTTISLEQCVSDRSFVGSTVRNGGVGAQ